MTPDERLELDIIFQSEREQRIAVASKSKAEHRAPRERLMTYEEWSQEFDRLVTLFQSLEPWQREALHAVVTLMHAGIIRGSVRRMERDIQDVIEAYREKHELGGAQ